MDAKTAICIVACLALAIAETTTGNTPQGSSGGSGFEWPRGQDALMGAVVVMGLLNFFVGLLILVSTRRQMKAAVVSRSWMEQRLDTSLMAIRKIVLKKKDQEGDSDEFTVYGDV